jgi:hypothetical protein
MLRELRGAYFAESSPKFPEFIKMLDLRVFAQQCYWY